MQVMPSTILCKNLGVNHPRPVRTAATGKLVGERLQHFFRKPVIDQKDTSTCHTVALTDLLNIKLEEELLAVTHGCGLSTKQVILDHFSLNKPTKIKQITNLILRASRKSSSLFEEDLDNVLGSLQAGWVSVTFSILQAQGCEPRSLAESSIDEAYDLFDTLRVDIRAIVDSGEKNREVIESRLLSGALGELFAQNAEVESARDGVKKILAGYTMHEIDIRAYNYKLAQNIQLLKNIDQKRSDSIYNDLRDLYIRALETGPVAIGGSGHAVVLLGYNEEKDVFCLRDSCEAPETLELTSEELVARNFTKMFILTEKPKSFWSFI